MPWRRGPTKMPKIRLHQFLSKTGRFPSKRSLKDAVWRGEVSVAGSIVKDIAFQFNPNTKHVEWNGQRLILPSNHRTFLLNKPYGVICSRLNKQERRLGKQSVFAMIEDKVEAADFDRFVSVGRLDEATTGLLILTTDGGMVHTLASPEAKVAKRYEVTTARRLDDEAVQRLRIGVEIELETNGDIETYITAPAEAAIESDGRLRLVINEGKKRQIRRMVSAVGGEVVALHRRSIGRLDLRDHRLNQGDVLDISDQDVLAMVGVDVEDKRP